MKRIECTLNEDGYPTNPDSIFIAIQRKFFPHIDTFQNRLGKSEPNNMIGIPIKNLGRWETLYGFSAGIKEFKDGTVIHYPQYLPWSPLKWPNAILWVPKKGSIGILNPQWKQTRLASEEEIRSWLDESSQRHMENSTSLRYMVECLFRHQDQLPDGTQSENVFLMTQFEQIELLERMLENPSLYGNAGVDMSAIHQFITQVDKQGFRTSLVS